MAKHPSHHRNPLRPLPLGPLPVEVINLTLNLELEPGHVIFSIPAQRHALKRHPVDFPRCLPYTGSVIANPLFIGDDFRNPDKIELISRIAALGGPMLVAISVEMDANGIYHVTSCFPFSEAKITARLSAGFLCPARKT